MPRWFSAEASFHHYLHMAQGNFREYLRGDVVRPKKYFCVLRPLLAMRWLEAGRGPVPIEFVRLLDATIPSADLRGAIDVLMNAKAAGQELDNGPRIPIISDFVERLPLCRENLRIGEEQVFALHAGTTGARSNKHRCVTIAECDLGVVGGYHLVQSREGTVGELHHEAVQRR